jgi:hypothetical protein
MTRFDEMYSAFARPALEHQFGELEDVTFITRRTAAGEAVDTEYTIAGAIQRGLLEKEQHLGVVTNSAVTMIWSIDRAKLTAQGITPRRGDAIRDAAGNNWTIMGWNEAGLKTQYDFSCESGLV